MTGIPIVNVNNNCSTGSTALLLGKNAIQSGQANCVLALGTNFVKSKLILRGINGCKTSTLLKKRPCAG